MNANKMEPVQMESKISLARYIRLRREALGKSQQALADELYYTQQAISRLESVAETFPYASLDTLCRALDCSPDDLYLRNLNDPHYAGPLFKEEELGEVLKRLREKQNVSKSEFASAIGITERSLRNYENGVTLPSWKVIESLCDAFDLLPSGLAKREEPAPAPMKKMPKAPVLLGVVGLSIVLAASMTLMPFLLQKKNASAKNESEYPAMTVVEYSVEESEPALLAAYCEKTTFTALGETAEIRIYDPTSRLDLHSNAINLDVINCSGDGANFSYSIVDGEEKGTFRFTLLSAAPGTLWEIRAGLSSEGWFDPFAYGRYSPGETAEVASGSKIYFVKEGKALCEGNAEVHAVDGGASFDVYREITFANDTKAIFGQTFEANSYGVTHLPLQNRRISDATYENVLEQTTDLGNGHSHWRAYSRGYAKSAVILFFFGARYEGKDYEFYCQPLTVFIDPPAGE